MVSCDVVGKGKMAMILKHDLATRPKWEVVEMYVI